MAASTRRVSSRQHPFVRRCRALAGRSGAGAAVLLDGEHLVREALRAGLTIEGVLIADGVGDLAGMLEARGIPHYAGPASVVAAASPVRTPSGVVGVAEWTPAPLESLLNGRPLVVGLVDVQDPGNVGSVIRSAHALGASGVLALGATSDPAGWKALRGAMGSTFHLPVGRADLDTALRFADRHDLPVAVAVAHGGDPVASAGLVSPLLLLVGNEGAGLPAAVLSAARQQLSIPMRPGVDSLNVAVSAAILIWELGRRAAAGRPPA